MMKWAGEPGEYGSEVVEHRPRALLYCCISDDKRDGAGVERQEELCRNLCAERGWSVEGVYVDNDLSATRKGVVRPEFERLLADVEADPRGVRIVTYHTDRLVRLNSELDRVIRLDVPVIGVTAGLLDLSTPAGRAVAHTITAWARYETEQGAQRKKDAHEQNARAGGGFSWGANRPYGYDRDNGRVVLVESEAAHLRVCYGMLHDGRSFADCARYLDSQGQTTSNGHQWNARLARQTLVNPRNGAMRTYRGKIVSDDGQWEPVIPREEFVAIIGAVTREGGKQKGKGKTKALLSSLTRCGVCGGPFARGQAVSRVRNKHTGEIEPVKRWVYRATLCGHTSAPLDWLDDHVSKELLRHLQSPAQVAARGEVVADDPEAVQAAARAVQVRSKLGEVEAMFEHGTLGRDAFERMHGRLTAELADLESKATAYYRPRTALDMAQSPAAFVKAWKNDELTDDERRAVLAQHIERIEIARRSGREKITPKHVTITFKA